MRPGERLAPLRPRRRPLRACAIGSATTHLDGGEGLRHMRLKGAVLLAVLVIGVSSASAQVVRPDHGPDWVPTGKGSGEHPGEHPGEARVQTNAGSNGIFYHGGPLLETTASIGLYYIWYGNWSGNTATTILTDLASAIAPSLG